MALFWGSFLVASIGIIETSGGYISIFWGGPSVENLPELSNFHTFCTFVLHIPTFHFVPITSPHSSPHFNYLQKISIFTHSSSSSNVLFASTHISNFRFYSYQYFQQHPFHPWNSAFATKQPSKIIPIQHYLVSKYHLKPPFCLMGH